MDIQEIDLRRLDFEAMHPVARLFNFDHEKLTYFGDAYDDAKRLNDLWSTWCACVGLLYLETNTAKAQAVPEWISVKNAMPKAGSQVLTYDDYGFVSVENIDGCEDPNNVYFSHWLPLPPVEKEPTND